MKFKHLRNVLHFTIQRYIENIFIIRKTQKKYCYLSTIVKNFNAPLTYDIYQLKNQTVTTIGPLISHRQKMDKR